MIARSYSKELPFEFARPRPFRPGKDRDGPWQVQEKLDGEHVVISDLTLHGRRKSQRGVFENKWFKLPSWLSSELRAALRRLTAEWVEGELIVVGGTSTDVKHVLKIHDPQCKLQFVAFRIPELFGTAKPCDQLHTLREAGFHVPRCLNCTGQLVQDGEYHRHTVIESHNDSLRADCVTVTTLMQYAK